MPADDQNPTEEQRRVAAEIASRLEQRGVTLNGKETGDELATLLETVERFEAKVEKHGGDLMMDEPVKPGSTLQPDNPAFVLPKREGGESVVRYAERIQEAGAAIK